MLELEKIQNQFYLSHKGYCYCCDKEVVFEANNNWLRDHLLCTNCQSLPRERALMFIIQSYFPNWESLAIHESSPAIRGASIKLKERVKNYTSSQYYPNQ